MIYATKQSYLERQRENALDEHIYKRITDFQEVIFKKAQHGERLTGIISITF